MTLPRLTDVSHVTDGPTDERCHTCSRLDPINCPCPTEENDVSYPAGNVSMSVDLATEETEIVLQEVADERLAQVEKWGIQSLPTGGEERWVHAANEAKRINDERAKAGTITWADVLLEEVFEALAETNPITFAEEMVQVAAVAVAAVEDVERALAAGDDE